MRLLVSAAAETRRHDLSGLDVFSQEEGNRRVKFVLCTEVIGEERRAACVLRPLTVLHSGTLSI